MTPSQALLLLAAFGIGVALTAVVMWARERWSAQSQSRVAQIRDTYEPLFADLWSDEMHKRLAALFVAQRVARSKSGARGLGQVLVSFVRRRLAAESGGDAYDDVRLALTLLASDAVRQALKESGQGLDLSGLDFRGASLAGINLQRFRLAQCVFDRCRLAGARLSDCDLSGSSLVGADLSGADLRRADFSEADLTDADFTRAKVAGANFTNSNIGGAILSEAQGLVQEQLDQAFGDSGTAVPERMRFVPGRVQRLRRE
ncbi:MAG: pentapeptide repeat-containing protein [Alphaproteobacteria bacterium]|nr:pentapeptide repeat-containing protein [Alphaproteobacteria bacterium]